MKERRITLRIYDDIPTNIVGSILNTLPEKGVNIYKTSIGGVAVSKSDYRKTEIYQIYKTNWLDND